MTEIFILLLLGVLALLYLYYSHIYRYWLRKGLPQPPTTFGFGNISDTFFVDKNIGLIHDEIYRSYPCNDAVGIYGFFTPKLLLRSPELIKRVTVTDFSSFHDNEISASEKLDPYFAKDPFVVRGEQWKPVRAKIVSTMTPARMKEIFPLMKNTVPKLYEHLNDNPNMDFEAKELATLFTMDNVSDTVFGISSNCFSDPEAPFRKFGDLVMKETLQGWKKSMILVYFPKVRDLLGLTFLPKAVSNYLEEVVRGMVAYRQSNNISRNDLFQYVLKKESGNFTELMNFGSTFFFEGFETASMVASTAIYELALNPKVEQTLYEEVKNMYNKNEDLDYESLMNLPYLEQVIKEAQRKYPVLWYYSRLCTKSCTLDIDGKPVEIESGTPVVIPVFTVHRDPSYYPDPEVFDPERFNEENIAARPAYTYIPFGEGPRICPGQKYGLLQVKLLLSSIVYKYRILRSEKTPLKVTFSNPSILVMPCEPLWIKLEKRV